MKDHRRFNYGENRLDFFSLLVIVSLRWIMRPKHTISVTNILILKWEGIFYFL